ncbi:MAG: hypothetical protein ABSD75_28585 [Terriglobales bacterium]|jgi:DNA-binding beta-propeller fold protein YncE
MHSVRTHFARITAVVATLFAFISLSFAANPLKNPWGLALDSAGNLYVANTGANNILVFNPGGVLQSSQTITAGIGDPTAVAIDSFGNVWVANLLPGNGNVSEYTGGVQNTSATITQNILGPAAIAIDNFNNLYVVNDYSYLTIYEPTDPFSGPSQVIQNVAPSNPIYGVSAGAGAFSWSGANGTYFAGATCFLSQSCPVEFGMPASGFALATTPNGTVYIADQNETVSSNIPAAGGNGAQNLYFLKLSFPPYGIAVDSTRNRIYLSDFTDNEIWVYTTQGKFIKTIK